MTGFLKYALRDMSPTTREYYDRLAAGTLATTRCRECDRTGFPPLARCPRCGDTMEWIELPLHGRLYAFTQQDRATRFARPTVFAIADLLPGIAVPGVIHCAFDDLAIGDPVTVSPFSDDDTAGLTLLEFVKGES